MERLLIFGILSIPLIVISRKSLIQVKSHGFYRFFSWECILWLLIANLGLWFKDPFRFLQLVSWILLFISAYLVIAGFRLMKRAGKSAKSSKNDTLYQFERTSELIDTGIFRYIRHPLYSSLLFLTWGIFFKNTSLLLLLVSVLSTLFLYLTALIEEKECLQTFGEKYAGYMKRSKRFIPFLF